MNIFLKEIQTNNSIKRKGIGSKNYCSKFYEGIGNIQKAKFYLYGASSKVGKTTAVDYLHIIIPYIEGYRNIKYYYFGWEIAIADKLASFCSFFLKFKYNLNLDSNTILGLERDLTEEELEKIEDIYKNELTDLFGVYDEYGELVKEGIIVYDEERYDPAAFDQLIMEISEKHGKTGLRRNGKKYYMWNDITQHVHIIIDHIGKTKKPKNSISKMSVDELTDSCVRNRNFYHFTFILISQFNRSLGAIDRRGLLDYNIRPEKSDFKDSSNGAEDCDFLFALFNPILFGELESIKVDGKVRRLRKGENLVVSPGFRTFYLLEARRKIPFEFAFELQNSSIMIQ